MIPAALLVRRPPALAARALQRRRARRRKPRCRGAGAAVAAIHHPAATNFFCCATHSGPIIHTVSYAMSCGIPLIAAVTIYSVEGLAGLGGRIAFGIARRPLRRKARAGRRPAAAGVRRARPMSSCVSSSRSMRSAALFGFIYAGMMPLYAVIVRENFPLRMMGTVIGGTAMAGSLGMATGRGRRPDLRHLRELRLALCRLLGLRAWRFCDRADIQAVSQDRSHGWSRSPRRSPA